MAGNSKIELIERALTPQFVGAQRTCPPELWGRSRLEGAGGSFNCPELTITQDQLIERGSIRVPDPSSNPQKGVVL
jgi:hypothetical protein